ncbi:MAG: DUF1947 domain-containing protein [Candidatus Hadarchaeales archaeon]
MVRRYCLRKSEIRELKERVEKELGLEVEGKRFEVMEEKGRRLILVDSSLSLLEEGGKIFPFLGWADRLKRKVVVDMGAVPHLARGADVMSPGVVRVEGEIKPGEIVAVVDERHGKALAVGEALVAGGEMMGRKGKVVRNLHHVGDAIWKLAGGGT